MTAERGTARWPALLFRLLLAPAGAAAVACAAMILITQTLEIITASDPVDRFLVALFLIPIHFGYGLVIGYVVTAPLILLGWIITHGLTARRRIDFTWIMLLLSVAAVAPVSEVMDHHIAARVFLGGWWLWIPPIGLAALASARILAVAYRPASQTA